jgi:hypothetical protein
MQLLLVTCNVNGQLRRQKCCVLCVVGVIGSLGSSVNIVSAHGLDDRGSITRRSKVFLLATVSTPAVGPCAVVTGLEVCTDPALGPRKVLALPASNGDRGT